MDAECPWGVHYRGMKGGEEHLQSQEATASLGRDRLWLGKAAAGASAPG